MTPYNSIVINYEARPDIVSSFLNGYEVQTLPTRIASVSTFSQGSLVNTLSVNYQQSCSSGVSLVSSVQLCGTDSATCFPPTTFYWDDSCTATGRTLALPAFSLNPNDPPNKQQMDMARVKSVDWNADGMLDFVYVNGFQTNQTMTVYINRGGGLYSQIPGPSVFVTGDFTNGPQVCRVTLN